MTVTTESPRTSGTTGENLVVLDDVTVDFKLGGGSFGAPKRTLRAVDHVSLSIPTGRTVGLVGGTGSGKSTIGHMIMGMLEPTSGSLKVAGQEIRDLRGEALQAHRRRVQVVLQDPYSSLDPRMKVEDIIAEPLTLGGPMGSRRAEFRARVLELLRVVGLPESKAELYPHQFSGGQRQRIAIARALAPGPQIMVLDEPTSALDVSVRAQIINLLKNLQEKLGVTYLVISHDLISVAYLSETVAVMFQGRIVEIGPVKEIYQRPRHPYTLLLLASAPSAEGAFMIALPRDANPQPQPEGGCRYYSRCSLRAMLGNPERCRVEEPVIQGIPQGHQVACHFPERTKELAAV